MGGASRTTMTLLLMVLKKIKNLVIKKKEQNHVDAVRPL